MKFLMQTSLEIRAIRRWLEKLQGSDLQPHDEGPLGGYDKCYTFESALTLDEMSTLIVEARGAGRLVIRELEVKVEAEAAVNEPKAEAEKAPRQESTKLQESKEAFEAELAKGKTISKACKALGKTTGWYYSYLRHHM